MVATKYEWKIEESINQYEALIICTVDHGATAAYIVSAAGDITMDCDSDNNPADPKGCWPDPSTAIIAEATAIANGAGDSYPCEECGYCMRQCRCIF